MDNGSLKTDIQDPREYAFGFGRRLVQAFTALMSRGGSLTILISVCPGRHYAENNLWMNFATLLSVTNISKPIAKDGTMIEPDLVYEFGIAVK